MHDMRAEIEAQRNLSKNLEHLGSDIDNITADRMVPEQVHLVGSGDSYFAAEAVSLFLQSATKAEHRTYTAHEFSQYVSSSIGPDDLVVPISVSGNSIRTIEAARRAAENEATVIGVTNSSDGTLYSEFPDSILMRLETEPGWVPGTLTYIGTIATLYRLGIQLMTEGSESEAHFETLTQTLGFVGEIIDATESTAQAVARNLTYTDPTPPFYFIGGGPSEATARYNSAKFLEIGLPRTLAVGQESEEFMHAEYWVLEKNNPVFVIAPTGSGFDRTLEIAAGLREFGNDLVVVTDSSEMAAIGKYSFELPSVDNLFSPLLYPIPLQLVCYHYMLELGLDPSDGDHVDPNRKNIADKIHSRKQY
jgi:glucosamine--fructose-6-phosphate aminotransferase (isomerizing)